MEEQRVFKGQKVGQRSGGGLRRGGGVGWGASSGWVSGQMVEVLSLVHVVDAAPLILYKDATIYCPAVLKETPSLGLTSFVVNRVPSGSQVLVQVEVCALQCGSPSHDSLAVLVGCKFDDDLSRTGIGAISGFASAMETVNVVVCQRRVKGH